MSDHKPQALEFGSHEEAAPKCSPVYPQSCHNQASKTTVLPLEKVNAVTSIHTETYSFLPVPLPLKSPRGFPCGFVTKLFINRKTRVWNSRKMLIITYLKIKYPSAKLFPFFNIWNSVVKTALSHSQHLLKKNQNFLFFINTLCSWLFRLQILFTGKLKSWGRERTRHTKMVRHMLMTFTHCIYRT